MDEVIICSALPAFSAPLRGSSHEKDGLSRSRGERREDRKRRFVFRFFHHFLRALRFSAPLRDPAVKTWNEGCKRRNLPVLLERLKPFSL